MAKNLTKILAALPLKRRLEIQARAAMLAKVVSDRTSPIAADNYGGIAGGIYRNRTVRH